MALHAAPWAPWPRFDRRVYLLLLDDQRRLLLCGRYCGGWTVPQVRMPSGARFMESAIRFLDEQFGLTNPRVGSVYGFRQSRTVDNWEFDRVTAARVFIIRINDAEGQQSSREYPRTLDGASQTYEDGGGRSTLRASSL
ncbi:NUDIX domain-containing protein [Streptomyces griseus]|uniref:NUDIX domain-containing protein n=1 Tax=Streptomyces griseus TaxID=1911 RepID=UPI0036E9E6B9